MYYPEPEWHDTAEHGNSLLVDKVRDLEDRVRVLEARADGEDTLKMEQQR